jgi:hypothetical protein
MLHVGSSTASHRRPNAVWLDTLPESSAVVVFELAQNTLQLLSIAYPAIRLGKQWRAECCSNT